MGFRKVKLIKNTFIALLTIALLAVSPVAFADECPLCVAAENGDLSEVKRLLNFAGIEDPTGVNDPEDKQARYDALVELAKSGDEGKKRVKEIIQGELKRRGIADKLAQERKAAFIEDPDNKIFDMFEYDEELTNVYLRRVKENMTNVNREDKYGWTALMRAAGSGHSEVVKVLLENGADVNYKNKDGWWIGWTALMRAAESGQNEVAKILLECGG
ncbi:MAG: ankyrin repeat domain-containing protein [Gammaproteobacteria bacterium WSBS_2016_MAG_OTU1]